MAIQVPHVGLHFSPARYERLMCLWTALSGSDHQILVNDGRKLTEPLPSWHPGDHAGDLRVLLWGVIPSLRSTDYKSHCRIISHIACDPWTGYWQYCCRVAVTLGDISRPLSVRFRVRHSTNVSKVFQVETEVFHILC